jgi:hypothetical protein
VLRLWCVCALRLLSVGVEAVGKEEKVGEKVEAVGERVGVEVTKKEVVVGEGVVEDTKGGLVTEVEEE